VGYLVRAVTARRSCSREPRLPAIADHSRALAEHDWLAGPALASGLIGRHCQLEILDAGDVQMPSRSALDLDLDQIQGVESRLRS